MADTQQTPAEGSFAWFLAKGLDPYTGQPLKEGEKPRGPKRSSKRPEAKSAPKSGSKAKSAPHVVNYVPPKIGQGPGRVAGSIAINTDAIGPAFRNAAASLERALSRPRALADGLRAAQQQLEYVGGNSTLSTPPRSGRSLAAGLRSFIDAMGGPVSSRMVEHSTQQRQRMAAGDYSPTRPTSENIDLAGSVAGGLLGTLKAGKLAAGLRARKAAEQATEQVGRRSASVTEQVAPAAAQKARLIKDLRGRTREAPREFYRGTNPGSTERIRTGKDEWDSHLFAADNERDARLYGSNIETIRAKPEAKILYEGTREWQQIAGKWRNSENMLEYADRAAKAARAAGYDAAWFKRQGDIGTAIFNPDAFVRNADMPAPKSTAAMLAGGMSAMGVASTAEAGNAPD